MTFTSRFAAIFLSLVLMISVSGLAVPQRAYASDLDSPSQVATGITSATHNIITSVQSTITAITQAKVLTNPIFYAISQAVIQSMVKDTVSWINSGFQGSPAYATDLKATILDAADQEAIGFIKEYTSSLSINSPFRDAVAQDVLKAYYISTSKDGFFLQNPYTLNQVSPNPRALAQGDLTQGGLPAFLSQSLNPANNWFGAQDLATRELNSRVTGAAGQLNQEAGWGSGFLSFRKCDASAPLITNTSGQMSATINVDGTTTYKPSQTVATLTSKTTCLSSHIETPGSVIAGTLNHTLGLGSDSLIQAKDFDEIVNALLGQLVGHVLGATGLGGLSQGSAASGGRAYFDQSTNTTSGATASAGVAVLGSFLQILDGQTAQLQGYLTNWQTINSAATSAKATLLASTCVPNAQSIIDSQIQPVITQAATAIGAVPSGITAIDTIRTQVKNAATLSSAAQTSTLQQASASYQTLLSSNTLPSIADFTFATQQSQDTGSASPASLLTQMNQLTAQARCGA